MKIQVTFLFLLLNCVSQCQQNPCFVYKEVHDKGFACVKDDTISFVLPQGDYYYGTYHKQDSFICVHNNLLTNRNHFLETNKCDSSKMEIEITFLMKDYGYGHVDHPDTNIYVEKAKRIVVFYDNDNQIRISDTTGIVSFDKKELYLLGDTLSCFIFVDGMNFRTEAVLPTSQGKRYNIIQKCYNMNPFGTKQARPYTYTPNIYFKNNNKSIIFDYGDQLLEYFQVSLGQSCLGELRKRYPDL